MGTFPFPLNNTIGLIQHRMTLSLYHPSSLAVTYNKKLKSSTKPSGNILYVSVRGVENAYNFTTEMNGNHLHIMAGNFMTIFKVLVKPSFIFLIKPTM